RPGPRPAGSWAPAQVGRRGRPRRDLRGRRARPPIGGRPPSAPERERRGRPRRVTVHDRPHTLRRFTMQALIDKIRRREARCGIIGLGYVGLPLALEFSRAGFHTTGIDVDASKVERIGAGRSYIVDVSDAEIAEAVEAGRLEATTDFAAIRDLDTINICVPTPLRKGKRSAAPASTSSASPTSRA